MRRLLLSAALSALLAACGTRGPLTLPPPPEGKPAKPAKIPAAPAVDDSSKPIVGTPQ
jgi:predicted small lipoprotein YifL